MVDQTVEGTFINGETLPDRDTVISASSVVTHPTMHKTVWSINDRMDFICHTRADDPDPHVIISFGVPIVGQMIFIYNRFGRRKLENHLQGVHFSITSDGVVWTDYPVELTDAILGGSSPVVIASDAPITAIRLTRTVPNRPIHIRQITIESESEPFSGSWQQLTRRFATQYALEVDADKGVIIETPTGGNMKVLPPRKGPARINGVDGILIDPLGFFGNGLIQIANALHYAEKINAPRIYLPVGPRTRDIFCDTSKPITCRETGTQIIFDAPPEWATVLSGLFFYVNSLHPHLFSSAPRRYKLLGRIRHGLGLDDQAKPLKPDELVIHIRSGDVFGGTKVHPRYGQPPLSFYLKVLNSAAPSQVHLVFENRNNPVIDALETCLARMGIPCRCSSGILHEDIALLLRARHVVCGPGTFMKGIGSLSQNLERIYCFNRPINIHSRQDIEAILVTDHKGEYSAAILNRNWKNTPEQRSLMLTYPDEALEFAPRSS